MTGSASSHAVASRWSAVLVAALVAACSMATQARRDTRLRAELDTHQIHKPLREVWPAALRLLADRGYQLVGRDRLVVGEPPAFRLKHLTAGGFETGRTDHGLAMESMADASATRYHVEGQDIGGTACRVTFVAVRRTGDSPSEERSRDLDLELELIRRLEPDAASRIASAADAAK